MTLPTRLVWSWRITAHWSESHYTRVNFTGIAMLDLPNTDAGHGRALWLQSKIPATVRLLDAGGIGELLTFHDPALVTACDDLSGFGPGHTIRAGTFRQGDVQALPFQDDGFDVAVLTEVLEHVPLPWIALREAGRVAPRVLITMPFEARWQNPIAFRVAGHIRYATVDILALHLRLAGLDGEIGMLEWGGWSFLVADVARRAVAA